MSGNNEELSIPSVVLDDVEDKVDEVVIDDPREESEEEVGNGNNENGDGSNNEEFNGKSFDSSILTYASISYTKGFDPKFTRRDSFGLCKDTAGYNEIVGSWVAFTLNI
jgi:predicted PolB exonuclease-like 3'-5' exonuclease